MSINMNALNAGVGVFGGLLHGALIKKRSKENKEFKEQFDAYMKRDSGVINNTVLYGDKNAEELATMGKTNYFPSETIVKNTAKSAKTHSHLGYPTQELAHGGVIGDTTSVGGYYHGGQGGVGDRMMWQKENFKK